MSDIGYKIGFGMIIAAIVIGFGSCWFVLYQRWAETGFPISPFTLFVLAAALLIQGWCIMMLWLLTDG